MAELWICALAKAGTNPDQALTAFLEVPNYPTELDVNETFHIEGQPVDVRWRVTSIFKRPTG